MSNFNACRFCGRTDQEFIPNILECGSMASTANLLEDVRVICKCNNQTLIGSDSFDKALSLWNEENPTEPKQSERICKNCMHRVGTTYICEFQNEEVDPLHTCSEFLGW